MTTHRMVGKWSFSAPWRKSGRRTVHVRDGIGEEEFVALRTDRDATLELPTLILPSVQINMRAGRFPEPESNGTRYLKIPLNAF